MKCRKFFGSAAVLLAAMLVMVMVITIQPASAQYCIPEGATIDSATFSIYERNVTNEPVTVHRVSNGWMETVVTWNNFGGSYDPLVVGSFTADSIGWQSVDLTSLVQDWVDGVYPNYGLYLQSTGAPVAYWSSEYPIDTGLRPKLEICYATPDGSTCFTIQRPGTEQDGVADATISQLQPDQNNGSHVRLTTATVNNIQKQSLLWFNIEICPPDGPGTGTPGYWMNHPEAWPVEEITIGGVTYAREDAISYMQDPVRGDKTFTMFPALVAAKLNVLVGNDDSCIADIITAADAWMAAYGPVGSGVAGSSMAWQEGEYLYLELDDYNNGFLCAPSRDALEELEEEVEEEIGW